MAVVHVPQNEAAPVIRELLAAAERLGLPASVVATSSDGIFGFSLIVPDEVGDMAAQIRIENRKSEPAKKSAAKEPAKLELAAEEPVAEEPAKRKPGRPRKATAPAVDEAPEE